MRACLICWIGILLIITGCQPEMPITSTITIDGEARRIAVNQELYGLTIENCTGLDSRSSAAMIVGLPESRLKDVKIRNCFFSVAKDGLRPVRESDMFLGLPDIEERGMRIRFVDGLELENVHVEGAARDVILEDEE